MKQRPKPRPPKAKIRFKLARKSPQPAGSVKRPVPVAPALSSELAKPFRAASVHQTAARPKDNET